MKNFFQLCDLTPAKLQIEYTKYFNKLERARDRIGFNAGSDIRDYISEIVSVSIRNKIKLEK
jgi:hypothetical protein